MSPSSSASRAARYSPTSTTRGGGTGAAPIIFRDNISVPTIPALARARAHLDAAGVTGLFDFVAGFDSGHGGKPAPGQLLAFCASMALTPEEVVMVGDSRHDLVAGRAAGMRCVAVLTGMATAQELAPYATAVLDDIGALPDWLDHHATH